MRKLSYLEAIKESVVLNMKNNKNIIAYAEGSDPALGSFHKKSELVKEFGNERIFDTPLSEAGMQGLGIGAAINGIRPIFIWFRIDFMLLGMDLIFNHAAKLKNIYNINCPIVIKTTIGRGWGQGPNHSQAFHGIFSHFPGVKVVLPSNAYDAKGLMNSALKEQNPIIYIEHKSLFASTEFVPKKNYYVKIGKAKVKKKGKDITLVSFSSMVRECELADKYSEYDCEIIDMISSYPLDVETVIGSVKKTKRLIIVDVDWIFGGISAEIAAQVYEKCKKILKKKIIRMGMPHNSVPTSWSLEKKIYPDYRKIINQIKKLI